MKLFDHHGQLKLAGQFLLIFTSLFLIAITVFTQKFFGQVSLDQTISTIQFGVHGALSADSIYLKRFCEWCLTYPLLITAFLLVTQKIYTNYRQPIQLNLMIWALFCLAAILFFHQFQILNYVIGLQQLKEDFFEKNYVDPKQVVIEGNQTKNLLLIYVESLEATYENKRVFGQNLLAPLQPIKEQSISFHHYLPMPGTGWTIAGIVATQCGLPLKQLTIFNGNRMGENINHFLPNAKCLGDILAEHGYKNIFLNGASSEIGGKANFFKDHHYHEIYGKEEWLKLGFTHDRMSHWGISDHDLFEQAKLILEKNMASKQKFNLTLLTVDMHGYGGQLSSHCQKLGYKNFPGVIECTAHDLAKLIKYIQARHWLNKLNIVIIGDHLAMENSLTAQLNSSPRSIYNVFISEEKMHKNTDTLHAFSMLPTMLRFIGFNYHSDKLGLGYSALIDPINQEPPNYLAEMAEKIKYYSPAYAKLWLKNKHI